MRPLAIVISRPRVALDSIRALLVFGKFISLGFAGGKTKELKLFDGSHEQRARAGENARQWLVARGKWGWIPYICGGVQRNL